MVPQDGVMPGRSVRNTARSRTPRKSLSLIHIWIPEEEIKRAREITAIEYLKKYQPNRLKKSSARNEWELTDHDSFKINELTSQWHWKSRDIGGTSALNFLIHVDG